MCGESAPRLVLDDELIGNVVQVIAHDLGLRADPEDIVADAPDQRRVPARGDGAERVPGMAGDQAELRRFDTKLFLDLGVGLTRRLVVLHAVSAEAPLEQIDDAAMLKLARLHLEQIVGEGEESKSRAAKLA